MIRGFAALLVLFFHLGFWIWRDPSDHATIPSAYLPFTPLFSRGWVGVEIFFVLSGFVIAYSTEGTTPQRFVQHRFNRLIPGACVCSTLTALVLLTAYPLRVVSVQWLRSITLFPVGPWVDGSYWTLPVELAFYLFVLLNIMYRRGISLPRATMALGFVSTAACFVELFRFPGVPRGLQSFLHAAASPPYACLLLLHGAFFAFGVFLYLSLVQRFTPLRVAVLVVCAAGCVAEVIWHDRGSSVATKVPAAPALPLSLWIGSVLALIAAVRLNGVLQDHIGRRGAWMARQIGVATYPLYLLHAKLGQVAIGGLHRTVGYGPALVLAAIFAASLAGIVSVSLEPRLRNVMQRLWFLGDGKTDRPWIHPR